MQKKFIINGASSTIKDISEQKYAEFKDFIRLFFPSTIPLIVQDVNYPQVNEAFTINDYGNNAAVIWDFINGLPDWVQPPSQPPTPQSFDAAMAAYNLYPVTSEDWAAFEQNWSGWLKNKIATADQPVVEAALKAALWGEFEFQNSWIGFDGEAIILMPQTQSDVKPIWEDYMNLLFQQGLHTDTKMLFNRIIDELVANGS